MKRIAFICTGNTCRSPMAEGYFRKVVGDKPVVAVSAGLGALDGMPVAAHAVEVMAVFHVDISGHLSQSLNDSLVAAADMLVPMTESHRAQIVDRWPVARDKTFLLREFAIRPDPSDMDIFDPMGCPRELYEKCFEMMKEPLERLGEIVCRGL